jgi:phage shock protein PspC (stress-responsive transcriptional regulator)
MTDQRTTGPNTSLDKFFAALRGIGVRRRTDDKWLAGVCSGLADRLGVDPVIVRAAMVLLILLGGIGVTVYLVAWALLPNDRDELAAERALRDGDGGSIVLIVVTAFALFGGSWWGTDSGWGFPWGLAITSLLVWWLVQRLHNHPDDGQGVSTQQSGTPFATGPSPAPFATGPSPAPFAPGIPPTTPRPVVLPRPRRRSGGLLMALLAIGVALVTYGSLSWLGGEYGWPDDHTTIALAGSLAAIGLLLVVLGLAGWRAGFVAFLAVVLAITAFSSSVVPAGIHLGGQIGDATWTPTTAADANYHLGIGSGVLDLSGLPREGLSEAKVPAYVGLGELKVVVPEGLTVQVVGHVGAGEILAPGDAGDGKGGTDVDRLVVIGDGPPEVVVDAGVGIGQLTVVKE